MKPIYAATQDCLGAIRQLRCLDAARLPSPELLHQRLRGFVEEMQGRLAKEGYSQQDVQDVTYALVALADEVALNAGEPLAGYWMGNLLQLHYFRENTAGDGFFTRLEAVRKDPHRKDALRIYALCLAFGFQGRYRIRGGELELMSLQEQLQRELGRPEVDIESLSPSGDRPAEALAAAKARAPLVLASVGALVLALLLFLGLKVSLAASMSSVQREMAGLQQP